MNNTNYINNLIPFSTVTNCIMLLQKIFCKLKYNNMKNILFSAIVMASVLVSCDQKSKETTTEQTHTMGDSTMMDNDSTMVMDKTTTMEKMYACPMHPEVQGNMDDKCPKCGMKLTEPVPEDNEESK